MVVPEYFGVYFGPEMGKYDFWKSLAVNILSELIKAGL